MILVEQLIENSNKYNNKKQKVIDKILKEIDTASKNGNFEVEVRFYFLKHYMVEDIVTTLWCEPYKFSISSNVDEFWNFETIFKISWSSNPL